MRKQVTPREKYQFGLLRINTTDLPAARAKLRRVLSKRGQESIPSNRGEHIHHYREWVKKHTAKEGVHNWFIPTKRGSRLTAPHWVLGLRYEIQEGYRSPFPVGGVVRSTRLASDHYHSIEWGRQRKHTTGSGTEYPASVREEDNGRSGWDRVVHRHADYGCVLSPCGGYIWVSACGSDAVHPLFRGRFLHCGRRYSVDAAPPKKDWSASVRPTAAALRKGGFPLAKVVRQTDAQISSGSGESLRSGGRLCVVVPLPPECGGGYYHVATVPTEACGEVRRVIATRKEGLRKEARDRRLDALLSSGRVWVGIDDSIRGGNCGPGTAAFAATLAKHLGVDASSIGGVRADVILGLRRDSYTLRACRAAAARYDR